MRAIRASLALLVTALLLPSAAAAQQDHMRCYKVKDPSAFQGTVDIQPQIAGAETGCAIKTRSKMLCVPAAMTITDDGGAPDTLIVGATQTKSQLCYKVKCPEQIPADQAVTDPFGTRTLTKIKPSIVCTPAAFAAPTCGDNDVNQDGEDCDGTADSLCPGKCKVDCTCGVCGDGIVDPGELCDTTSAFANIACKPDCTYDFSTVTQLYCSGACSMGGPSGCDQSDADIFCKLRTGSATSTASSYTPALAANANGFGCIGGTDLGPQPHYGVFTSVRYIDTNLSGTHGSGAVIGAATCLP